MQLGQYELRQFGDPSGLASMAASDWVEWMQEPSEATYMHVALSGGRISIPFLRAAGGLLRCSPELLKPLNVFWADERCVPPDHPDSNYGNFWKTISQVMGINVMNTFRFRGEDAPSEAAREMSMTLQSKLPLNASGVPVFDLVFLGMGEDGHVASLFPQNMTADLERKAFTFELFAPKPPPHRLTLSYRVLHAAKHVWVLVSGAGKKSSLTAALQSQGNNPLSQVMQGRELTRIYTDLSLDADDYREHN
jgi:6-phosphogluconolactonase